MTINELALIMQAGFADTHKKIDDSEARVKKHVDDAIDELAGMVAREFKVIHKEITILQDDVAILKTDVATLKVDVSDVKDSVECKLQIA